MCEVGEVLGWVRAGGTFFGESVDADDGFGRGVGVGPFG